MTSKSKYSKKLDAYWTFCDEVRAAFNRTAKFLRCEKIEVIAWFKTDDETLWGKPHLQKPDATNILKGVEDALLIDDSGNTVFCTKYWSRSDSIFVTLHAVQP